MSQQPTTEAPTARKRGELVTLRRQVLAVPAAWLLGTLWTRNHPEAVESCKAEEPGRSGA
jgi:hypothetical protein